MTSHCWKGYFLSLEEFAHGYVRHQSIEYSAPNAAGIDIGSSSHFVAVPADRSEAPVREFGCYTEDLNQQSQAEYDAKFQNRTFKYLQLKAKSLGFDLVPQAV